MNILHITTFLQGGAGRILTDLALAQKRIGDNVFVITSRTSEPGYCSYDEYLKLLRENQILLIEIDSSFKRNLALNLQFAGKVNEIINKYSIDIIHAHAAIPALTGIIGRSGAGRYIPVVLTMHGWGKNKSVEQEKMDVVIMNCPDQIVTASDSDRDLLVNKGVLADKVIRIYNGIVAETKTGLDDSLITELREYHNQGFKIIGCIGTICERKNQALLLEAVKILIDKHKIFCAFIGEGDLIPALKEYATKEAIEENVKFYGYIPGASAYLKYFDYLVLPSTSEGFGLAITEAFRERVPVIASNINVFIELIEDQITGFLFENNNINSLSDILENAFSLSQVQTKAIVGNAYSKFTSRFTLERMLQNYRELYQKLIMR